jgi:hypothetical protein
MISILEIQAGQNTGPAWNDLPAERKLEVR